MLRKRLRPPTKALTEIEVATRMSLPLHTELPGEAPAGDALARAKVPTTAEDPTRVGDPATEVKVPATTVEIGNTALPIGEDLPREVPATPTEVVTPTPDAHTEAEAPSEAEDARYKLLLPLPHLLEKPPLKSHLGRRLPILRPTQGCILFIILAFLCP